MATILIIDDDDEVRLLLKEVLEYVGHSTISAHNGAAGARMFDEQRPDLVLTDIIMPDVDGLEAIALIRQANPDALVVAMSGGSWRLSADYFIDVAGKLGATAVLRKPFSMPQLIAVIHGCLDGSGS